MRRGPRRYQIKTRNTSKTVLVFSEYCGTLCCCENNVSQHCLTLSSNNKVSLHIAAVITVRCISNNAAGVDGEILY